MKNQLRNFAGSDAYLLQQSSVLQELFAADLVQFTGMDNALNPDFLSVWNTAHTAALNQPDDTTVLAQLSQKTALLLELNKKAGVLWRNIKYFVEKAFPDKPTILAEFGSSAYYTASKRHEKMVMFLDELRISCTKYSTALLDVGLPTTVLTDLETFSEEFQTAKTQQELFKRTRLVTTQTRIDHFNEVFGYVSQVIAAAGIIFTDDAARKSQYVYMPGSSSPSNDQESYTGNVAANELKEIVEILFKPERQLNIENTGSVDLNFYLSLDGNIIDASSYLVPSRESHSISMGQIANSGDKLMVMNENTLDGSYKVLVSLD